MNEWMNEWMNACMHAWMNKEINTHTHIYILFLFTIYLQTTCMQGKGIRGFRMFLSIEPLHVHLYLILSTCISFCQPFFGCQIITNPDVWPGCKFQIFRALLDSIQVPHVTQAIFRQIQLHCKWYYSVLWPERAWWHSHTSSQKRLGGGNDGMLSHQGWSSTGKGCGWQGGLWPSTFLHSSCVRRVQVPTIWNRCFLVLVF